MVCEEAFLEHGPLRIGIVVSPWTGSISAAGYPDLRMILSSFANPARFMRVSRAALPWLGSGSLVVFALGLVWSLLLAPPDYQQGESVWIMFIQVPAAWMALSVYLFVAIASAVALVWRHPLGEIAGQAAAPIGAAFTLVCLATSFLWGLA